MRNNSLGFFLLIFFCCFFTIIFASNTPHQNPMNSTESITLNKTNVAVAVTFLTGGLAVGYLLGRKFALAGQTATRCNHRIKLDSNKIVDTVDVEDLISEKTAFCRCWQSKKFPFCDGSHGEHNKQTGDNVGPLCVKKSVQPVMETCK